MNKNPHSYFIQQRIHQQQGAVLFVSLIILILLTILGLSSMRSTLLQEKMAGNYKNKSAAFQGAEAALRAGEEWLETHEPTVDSARVYAINNQSISTTDKTWWWNKDSDGNPTSSKNGVAGPFDKGDDAGVRKQRYIIQAIIDHGCNSLESPCPNVDKFYIYRISAIDIGTSGISVLESYIKKYIDED